MNGTLVQGWLYQDQLEPVAELDGAGAVVTRFVYGTRSTVPDYLIKGGTTYRVISDHLGSVRLVVDAATGAVAQRLDYDEYGRVTLNTAPGFQPFGYAGGLFDHQTGLVRFGARDYDAAIGRWTAKDPLEFNAESSNFYSYLEGDPLDAIDPNGQCPCGDALTRLAISAALDALGPARDIVYASRAIRSGGLLLREAESLGERGIYRSATGATNEGLILGEGGSALQWDRLAPGFRPGEQVRDQLVNTVAPGTGPASIPSLEDIVTTSLVGLVPFLGTALDLGRAITECNVFERLGLR